MNSGKTLDLPYVCAVFTLKVGWDGKQGHLCASHVNTDDTILHKAKDKLNLTIISVNVRDRVCMYVCMLESVCSPNRLRYGNMNGTMLSQIFMGMFLAHQVYQKQPKTVKKRQKSISLRTTV